MNHQSLDGVVASRLRLHFVCGTLLLGACTAEQHFVSLDARENAQPVAGLELHFLPYDPDAILDSLARAFSSPAPVFPGLEEALLAWRPEWADSLDAASSAWLATRDSVSDLSATLRTMDPTAPGYVAEYRRFRDLYGRLAQRSAQRQTVFRNLTSTDRELALRAQTAADSLRAWEDSAFAGFEAVVITRLEQTAARPAVDTTDAEGSAEIALAPGRWWVVGVVRDRMNPFIEHYWKSEFRIPRWRSRTWVNLEGETSRTTRWRH